MGTLKIALYLVIVFIAYKGYVAFKNFEIGVGDRLAEIEEIADFENKKELDNLLK